MITLSNFFCEIWQSKLSFFWNFCLQRNHYVSGYTSGSTIHLYVSLKSDKQYIILLHLDSILAPAYSALPYPQGFPYCCCAAKVPSCSNRLLCCTIASYLGNGHNRHWRYQPTLSLLQKHHPSLSCHLLKSVNCTKALPLFLDNRSRYIGFL